MAEASAPIVAERGREIVAFLGVRADKRLLDADVVNLPDAEQHREPVVSSQRHDRLVAAGSLLTVARAWISNPTHVIVPAWPDLLNHVGVSRSLLSSQTNPRGGASGRSASADNPCNGGPRRGSKIGLPLGLM